MERIEVRWRGGDRYEIETRGHTVLVDQPGSGDTGPTPTELWVSGLVSCVAYYAGSFLARRDVEAEGLAVRGDLAFAEDRPARVGEIRIEITLPPGFPEALTERLQAVVEHCTVHTSMQHPPAVAIALRAPSVLAAG